MNFDEWRAQSEWNGDWHDVSFARDAWDAAQAQQREADADILSEYEETPDAGIVWITHWPSDLGAIAARIRAGGAQ